MANASGIAQALAYVCAGIVYPDGFDRASITGRRVVVRRGWLLPSDLFMAQNIRNGTDFVTVTLTEHRNQELAEPLGQPWQKGPEIPASVAVSCDGGAVVVSVPQGVTPAGVVGVWSVAEGLSSCVAYAALPTDTPESIAVALGALIPGSIVHGATVMLPGVALRSRVVGYGQSFRSMRRQAQCYRVSVWTADATVREVLGAGLDQALSERNWLTTLDGRQAQLVFREVVDVDTMQNQALYRRDYFYEIRFDTLQVQWAPGMLSGGGTMRGNGFQNSFGLSGEVTAQQAAREALEAMAFVAQAQQQGAGAYPGLGVDPFGTVVAE